MRQARKDDGKLGLDDHYTRVLVRNLFCQALKTLRCDARVVSEKRGPETNGDGRNVYLLLLPKVVSDQLVVYLYLRGNGEDGRARGAHLISAEDKESSLEGVLQAMVQQGEDAAGQMSIVLAAAGSLGTTS